MSKEFFGKMLLVFLVLGMIMLVSSCDTVVTIPSTGVVVKPTELPITLPIPTGVCQHETVLIPSIKPTCTQKGSTEGIECKKCGEVFKECETIQALGHDFELFEGVAPTCTMGGCKEYNECTRCFYSPDYQKIPSPGHLLEDNSCTVCSYVYTEPMVYQEVEGGYSLVKVNNTVGWIVIPSEYNGKPVVEIGEEAFKDVNALMVTIPNSIKNIKSRAFYNCKMKKVIISDSVTVIEPQAFKDCPNLSMIEFGDNIEIIGEQAFYGCNAIEALSLPDKVETIGKQAFYNCKQLGELLMPDSVKEIGEEAFAGCTALAKIEFSDNLEIIGKRAFANCSNITSVILPQSLKEIGALAFSNCKKLVFFSMPSVPDKVGENMVLGSDKLTYMYLKAPSKPSRWHPLWCDGNAINLHWGYFK